MGKLCQSCHARIDDGMKICPNCGKVVPTAKKKQAVNSRQQAVVYSNSEQRTNQPAPKRVYEHPKRRQEQREVEQPIRESKPQKPKKRSKLSVIFKAVKVLIVLLVIYAVLYGVQIFRIKHSAYDFDTSMKMSCENYGEAVENYLDDAKWSYNPFTFTAACKGEHDGESYEIKFTAGLSVKVKAISIDGENVKSKMIKTELMGMFI